MDLLVHDGGGADPVIGLALEEALARVAPACRLMHVAAYLTPPPADLRLTDSRRNPVALLGDLRPGVTIAAARGAVLAAAEGACGPLSPRTLRDPERRWQERLLAQRRRSDSWHLTGRTKETPWTTRPDLTCTG